MTRRQKTPIIHRIRSEQYEQAFLKSPILNTKDFQKDKRLKQSNSRPSLAKNKYLKQQQIKTNKYDNEHDKIAMLTKENTDLRKQIVELKVQQFYQFDDKKLKDLLILNQSLKKQLKKYKEILEQTKLQNDFLRRTNAELLKQLQKVKNFQVSEKKNYKDNTLKTIALSPRNIREDEELTERIMQKPVVSSSSNNDYDQFQDYRRMLESKSTNKKDRLKKVKQAKDEYLLQLESNKKIIEPLSPRSSTKQTIALSPRLSSGAVQHKKRKVQYFSRTQI